jgi:hypothetical protein
MFTQFRKSVAIKHTAFVRTVVHKFSSNLGDELKTLAANKANMKPVPNRGPTNVRPHSTKFSRSRFMFPCIMTSRVTSIYTLMFHNVYALSQNGEKWLSAPSRLSVRPSASNNSAPTGRFFLKFYIWGFIENLSRKFKIFRIWWELRVLEIRPMYFYNISLNFYYFREMFYTKAVQLKHIFWIQ